MFVCNEEPLSERSRKSPSGQGKYRRLYLSYTFCSYILTAQRSEISASEFLEFVEHLQEEASIAIEKAEKAEEHHILAEMGDFGQHLVYRRASTAWEVPRRSAELHGSACKMT